MGHSQFDDASRDRAAWNAGKKVGTKRPFTQKQIWAIRFFLDRERRVRDRALFDLAIDSKLRGCDLVKIRIRDVVAGPEIRTRATVVQQKTGRPVQFEITSDVRASLLVWLERRGGGLRIPEPGRSLTPHEHKAVRAPGRRMGDRDRSASGGVWNTLAATNESVDDLQGDRQHPRHPDPARPLHDREHGTLSWSGRGGRAPLG